MNVRVWQAALLAAAFVAVGVAGGYWLAPRHGDMATAPPSMAQKDERQVLYWYDPMYPQQKFDQPGPSPFMDMELVPRYADEAGDSAAVSVDPSVTQNLGLRLARVERDQPINELQAVGTLQFNSRDIAVVQTRSGGFVERVFPHAPEDLIDAGEPLAELLVPEWAAAQEEFLALRELGDAELLAAARQRLRLAGMPAALIAQLERSGKAQPLWTVVSPIAGMLKELNVREGMTLAAGEPLATINGLSTVWLEVAIPEAETAGVRLGQTVEARLPAFPGEVLSGKVNAFLPQANLDSRTVRIRAELDNPEGRLRPGMSAQVRVQRSAGQSTLFVPNEAVIRTGRRALVMLAEDEGRYRPVEVRLGREAQDRVEVLEGLQEGQQVVASGQFLLDSEASLRGVLAQSLEQPITQAEPALHQAEGRIVEIEGDGLNISHGPFKTLGMPGMTMFFPVADTALLEGLKVGERIRFGVRETDEGLVIEQLEVQP